MSYTTIGDGVVTSTGITTGISSDGSVTITAGDYIATNFGVGDSPGGAAPMNGTVTVTGATSSISITDPLTPGFPGLAVVGLNNPGGLGHLEILNGARFTVTNEAYYSGGNVVGGYNNVRVGEGAGTTGRITVDGTGSRLESLGGNNRINAGISDGTGELIVSAGGYALATNFAIGQSGDGTLEINGPGSSVRASNIAGDSVRTNENTGAGRVAIGVGTSGDGTLRITNGGTLDIDNNGGPAREPALIFGNYDSGAEGHGQVTGAGSSINVTMTGPTNDPFSYGSQVIVGNNGSGVLKIQDNAQLNITGQNALLVVARGNFYQSNPAPQSELEITGGADVVVDADSYTGGSVAIGRNRETTGVITVDGAGSSLTVSSDTDDIGDYFSGRLDVGDIGTGILNVSNGATVSVEQLQVGNRGENNYSLGFYGDGTVNINSGGTVTVTTTDNTPYRGVILGRLAGTTGTLNIDGAAAQGGAARIGVGREGNGDMTVTNGASANAFFLDIARNSTGTLTVDGAGSVVTVSNEFGHFPGYGGAYLGQAGFMRVGRNAGSDGEIPVTNGGVINVINDPTGGYDQPNFHIARSVGSKGEVIIDGAGSAINVVQTGPSGDYYGGPDDGPLLLVGRDGEGTATVRNGGSMNVAGDRATLSVANGTGGGNPLPSFLNVETGGLVTVDSGTYDGARFIVANRANTNAFATVDGAGSAITVDGTGAYGSSAQILVGHQSGATGELTIQNGGSVENLAANGISQIAADVGSTGTVTVNGAASTLDAGALLTVGADFDFTTFQVLEAQGGNGLLELQNGGQVTAGRVAIGATGTVQGNGTINGDVEVLGGTLSPGLSPGDMVITGDLDADSNSTINLEVDAFSPAGQFDTISVGGIATVALGAMSITTPGGAAVPAGTSVNLLTAADLVLTDTSFTAVFDRQFGTIPAIGATTLNGQVQGYLLADTGSALQLQALGADASGPAGEIDFGAATLDGVDLIARNGFGSGSGGGFDDFALLGVSAVSGTAAADTIELQTTSDVTISGGDGTDILISGDGNDTINAGADNDVIEAGLGVDTITIGGGSDIVVGTIDGLNGDTITDLTGDVQIAVRDATGAIIAASITVAANVITVDAGGGNIALINSTSSFSGVLSNFTGPDPVPSPPNNAFVQGAGFFVAQELEGDGGSTTPVTFTVERTAISQKI